MEVVLLLLTALAGVGPVPSDTTVVLGSQRMDLTGDGEAEVLEVIGVGESLDSLEVTFLIRSSSDTLYSRRLRPLTPKIGLVERGRVLTETEYGQMVENYGSFFFAPSKFKTPEEFTQRVRGGGPAGATMIESSPAVIAAQKETPDVAASGADVVWEEIKKSGRPVFEYSGGYDAIRAIAWSRLDQRIYELLECC